jgi:hypothetical protein
MKGLGHICLRRLTRENLYFAASRNNFHQLGVNLRQNETAKIGV